MLLRIDALTRSDHSLLDHDDICYYIREYTTEGFQARPDNQLVFNLKCPINHTNTGRLFHKRKAIDMAASDIRIALNSIETEAVVFIPLPPSKLAGTPDYDPRVRDMLRPAEVSCGIRVVDALAIKDSRTAVHEDEIRPTVEDLRANLIVKSLDWVGTKTIALFDDVLVTGAQFKAAAQILREHDPGVNIVGLFWVRRTFP